MHEDRKKKKRFHQIWSEDCIAVCRKRNSLLTTDNIMSIEPICKLYDVSQTFWTPANLDRVHTESDSVPSR
jgi:hypothetical protein